MTEHQNDVHAQIKQLRQRFTCKDGDLVGLIDTEEAFIDSKEKMRFLQNVLHTEIQKKTNEALQAISLPTDEKL